MKVRVRFFARFREAFGPELEVDAIKGETLLEIVRRAASSKRDGYSTLFEEDGRLKRFVIVMHNGSRVEHADAEQISVAEGDEIAVFPPVAGG
ncbi:MAG: MoaD family protein [Methanomicrobiales archaeon]|nr:MoaD family protein [Methanomicrobiales archaeon]